jgi:hypothetical protein
MSVQELVLDPQSVDAPESKMPEVHPVFNMCIGSTMAELPLVLDVQLAGMTDLVPTRSVVVDSLERADLMARLQQNGWSTAQIDAAVPPSHYFHLISPFSETFDFDNPLNHTWTSVIHEPALERLAKRPDAPGCSGVPGLAKGRAEASEDGFRDFSERHLYELTQISPDTMALLPGVRGNVFTTFRGGTMGAVQTLGAILRSVMSGGELHLYVAMPDIYRGDEHAYANAYAALRELCGFHRFGGRVPLRGGRSLPPPFDSVSLIFASDGAVTLGHNDLLMLKAAILRGQIRARTQSAINARHVDLADVSPYDMDDLPQHLRLSTATSIQTVYPGTLQYIALEAVRRVVLDVEARFEAWCKGTALGLDETGRVKEAVSAVQRDLGLTADALQARLDPTPTPGNAMRGFMERINGSIASMEAEPIKQSMKTLPGQVRDAFLKFEGAWEDRARRFAQFLPNEITEAVFARFPDEPALALAAQSNIRESLVEMAKVLRQEAESARRRRDAAASQVNATLTAVQQASGMLFGLLNNNEVVRDAAHQATGALLAASLARIEQQRREFLALALDGQLTTMDPAGKPIPLPSVAATLGASSVKMIGTARATIRSVRELVARRQDVVGGSLDKRSLVFQHTLVFDGFTRQRLESEAAQTVPIVRAAPALVEFLKRHLGPARPVAAGDVEVDRTVAALLPMLPQYTESGRNLTDMLLSNPKKFREVVQILRNLRPFAPIDREVEDQQSLRNRRDTLVMLEIPGGRDGRLASALLREGIVNNVNQIVDSGDDEIRFHYLRDGLPYAALRPLAKYRERYEQYLTKPTAVSPHTIGGAHALPTLEPSRTNLLQHTTRLLYVAKAVLPKRLAAKPSGGFRLWYEQETGYGIARDMEELFPEFEHAVRWVAKHVAVRKALDAELKDALDQDQAAYTASLLAAWRVASGTEREVLEAALYKMGIDPHRSN